MFGIRRLLPIVVINRFKSRSRLEAENLVLRHQLNVTLRRGPARVRLHGGDRALLVWLTRLWPCLLGTIQIVRPETVLRWHRSGFRAYWRWKSRNRGGRPKIEREVRDLIRRMSRENPLRGAPRIHGELLKLGISIGETSVSKYMIRKRMPPSQPGVRFSTTTSNISCPPTFSPSRLSASSFSTSSWCWPMSGGAYCTS